MTTTTPRPRKAPRDHLPPHAGRFTFTAADGTSHTLPPPNDALGLIPGKVFRDAVMEGEQGELRLAFNALEIVGADPAELDALYALPTPRMLEVVGDWMRSRDESGATLGEA